MLQPHKGFAWNWPFTCVPLANNVNKQDELMQKNGIIDVNGTLTSNTKLKSSVPDVYMRTYLYRVGSMVRLLQAFVAAKKITVVQLVESVRVYFNDANILVAFFQSAR